MRIAVIFVFVVFTTIFAKERGEKCTTPNKESGTCVLVTDCSVIFDIIKNNKSRNGDIEFARKSQCGYDSKPLVCCGTTGNLTLPSRTLGTGVLPNRTECGLDTLDKRIIYGDETQLKEFPWMAALEYKDTLRGNNVGVKCGGSVINNRYVLTAAHCIATPRIELISVWLGEWKISTDPDCETVCADSVKKISIENKIPHPLYDPVSNANDIGLLRLSSDIVFTDYIRPICLPAADNPRPAILTHMTVAGWGLTENGRTSDIKLKVEIPILSNDVCRGKLRKSITSNQLCAGADKGKDSCRGDSGGPLMWFYGKLSSAGPQWYQEGIVSWGVGCARPEYPAVYTRVSAYIDWIEDTIISPPPSYSVPDTIFPTKRRGESCTTPNNEIATCVEVRSCKVIISALATNNPSTIQFAQKSQCGYDTGPLVCCGSSGYFTPPDTDSIKVNTSKVFPDRTLCGLEKESIRVLGGQVTDLDEFPWLAAVEYKNTTNGDSLGIKCGGSIITDRYVLTAAHCLRTGDLEATRVSLGDWRLSTDPDCQQLIASTDCNDPVQKINIVRRIPHAYFNVATGNNDIGLLLLEKTIEFTDYIRPICMPTKNSQMLPPNTLLTMAGWGIKDDGIESDIKLTVEVPLLTKAKCNKKYPKPLPANQYCAGEQDREDACLGDSGGPLMRVYRETFGGQPQWYQEGVISYGIGCGIPGYPAIYTRVSEYISWIERIILEE